MRIFLVCCLASLVLTVAEGQLLAGVKVRVYRIHDYKNNIITGGGGGGGTGTRVQKRFYIFCLQKRVTSMNKTLQFFF